MKRATTESSNEPSKTGAGLVGLARWMDRLGRVLLILVILGAIVFCLSTIQELRAPGRRPQLSSEEPQSPSLEDSLANMMNGDWQFASVPWSVKVKEVATAEALALMTAEVSALSVWSDTSEDDVVIQVLELLSPLKSTVGGNVCYSVDSTEFSLRGFAPLSMSTQIQLVRATKAIDAERSTFAEIIRRAAVPEQTSGSPEFLLPRRTADRTLAIRRDARGYLCAELVELESDVAQTVNDWKKAGWSVTPQNASQEASNDSISEGLGDGSLTLSAEQVFLCKNKSESIYAVVSSKLASSSRTMLLVRPTSVTE